MPTISSWQRLKSWAAENINVEGATLLGTILLLVIIAWQSGQFTEPALLEISAAAHRVDDKTIGIVGAVFSGGRGVGKAHVLATIETTDGNQFTAEGLTTGEHRGGPPSAQTSAAAQPGQSSGQPAAAPGVGAAEKAREETAGRFDLQVIRAGVPVRPGDGDPALERPFHQTIARISVQASEDGPDGKPARVGALLITSEGPRRIDFSLLALVSLVSWFLASVLLAFRRPADEDGRRRKYNWLIASSLLMTVLMITFIAVGLRGIDESGKGDRVMSLGFASIFRGTYVTGTHPEWLFSLTSYPARKASDEAPASKTPPPAATSQPAGAAAEGPAAAAPLVAAGGAGDPARKIEAGESVAPKSGAPLWPSIRGFGAPLWVILLSVLGAGILTLAMVVSGIAKPPNFDDESDVGRRIETMIRHQFYILFSPVGGVFSYQLLVAAEAASQPLTVAVAALGAGMVLNNLLDYAVNAAAKLIPSGGRGEGRDDGGIAANGAAGAKVLALQNPKS
jgi:hypothetical protein